MIEVNNLTRIPLDKGFLKRVAEIVLRGENKKELDVSLAIVAQNRIRELNKKYRGKNKATDVLSFQEPLEIVICLREVKNNAKRFGQGEKQELAKVLIHGILHILGYNHKENRGKTDPMSEKENYYLSLIFS
ncbi:MAG: rRNA maturation RNase YbeY [Candidatus Nealsonbacteria bacterium]|nr:rRNA maturation RNase YbeY [Candidatus Nealsonbacteria bacterium]